MNAVETAAMRPAITLDGDALRSNAAAFAALGAPVAAVVKQDGYGWGARRLARELDAVVDSYVVADLDELAALRPATAKPIRLLADAPRGRLAQVLDLGGIPNVGSCAALAEATAEARRRGGLVVRVGVLDAAGWSTIAPRDAGAFAAGLAEADIAVELWTHVTSPQRAAAILDDFMAARRAMEACRVRVVSSDVASTASSRRGLAFDRVRIGAGLFGAHLGASVDVRCALRVVAPVVRRIPPGETSWAGYGDTPVAADVPLLVLRCGYGDGFPSRLRVAGDVLSIGMQYTTRVERAGADLRVLIGAHDSVDALARRADLPPHALITGLAPRGCGASI